MLNMQVLELAGIPDPSTDNRVGPIYPRGKRIEGLNLNAALDHTESRTFEILQVRFFVFFVRLFFYFGFRSSNGVPTIPTNLTGANCDMILISSPNGVPTTPTNYPGTVCVKFSKIITCDTFLIAAQTACLQPRRITQTQTGCSQRPC